jgi:hypothetical protein
MDRLHQVRFAIADNGFENNAYAKRVQLLSDEQRIRVLTEGSQQL